MKSWCESTGRSIQIHYTISQFIKFLFFYAKNTRQVKIIFFLYIYKYISIIFLKYCGLSGLVVRGPRAWRPGFDSLVGQVEYVFSVFDKNKVGTGCNFASYIGNMYVSDDTSSKYLFDNGFFLFRVIFFIYLGLWC